MKAVCVREFPPNGAGATWKLFRCDPGGPLPKYVIVSAAVTIDHGPETYIFAANRKAEVTCWIELDGSFVGGMDHEQAIRGAGYEVEVKL